MPVNVSDMVGDGRGCSRRKGIPASAEPDAARPSTRRDVVLQRLARRMRGSPSAGYTHARRADHRRDIYRHAHRPGCEHTCIYRSAGRRIAGQHHGSRAGRGREPRRWHPWLVGLHRRQRPHGSAERRPADISGTPTVAGQFCVSVADVGNLVETVTYTLVVRHS